MLPPMPLSAASAAVFPEALPLQTALPEAVAAALLVEFVGLRLRRAGFQPGGGLFDGPRPRLGETEDAEDGIGDMWGMVETEDAEVVFGITLPS